MPSAFEAACPAYRVRIFLSVDLAGSTAYKNGAGKEWKNGQTSEKSWVSVTRDFYTKFPRVFYEKYKFCQSQHGESTQKFPCPIVWKTVGDEIIFYGRIYSRRHAAICSSAFLQAQNQYGLTLDNIDGRPLDIKGSGWVAAFPAPNVTVALDTRRITADQMDETFECTADEKPTDIDFLGHAIDSGFRISSRAASDRFSLSVELAWLLADASDRDWFPYKFNYHQRQILKGVLKDRPYPIISIETERNRSRRIVRDHERRLEGLRTFHAWELRDFLQHFMADERIELPALPADEGEHVSEWPDSYRTFAKRWEAEARAEAKRKANEIASEEPGASNGDGVPDELVRAADEMIASAQREAENTAGEAGISNPQ